MSLSYHGHLEIYRNIQDLIGRVFLKSSFY